MVKDQPSKKLRGLMALAVLAMITVLTSAVATAKDPNEAIAERIAPVGDLCMSGDDCAAAPVAAAPAEPRSGEQVYNTACTTCHAVGVSGAPRLGEPGDWTARIAQGEDVLFDHAWNGFNAMPAKGLCTDCSEDEIKAAIAYMLENSQ